MGAVGGLLGMGGGAGGTSFNIQSPVSTQQANTAYQGVQNSMGDQQSLLKALQAQNGIQNQSDVYGQLQGVVNGTGPNPAQAMLNQATGANVANQAALMAGQRGAAANPALMARQAAQQGAGIQQQAVGQGASLQAQQSLNALGQAGAMAGQQANQQIGQTNQNVASQQGEQQNLLNSIAGQNSANASLAAAQMKGQQGALGGLGAAAGVGLGLLSGGLFSGGAAAAAAPGVQAGGSYLDAGSLAANGGQIGPRSRIGMMARGGKVDIVTSPGEIVLSPQAVSQVRNGADPMHVGKKVPGKAAVGGAVNSYSNDTVPTKAASGSIVVPRSATQSKNPDRASKQFVDATLAKRKKKA